MDCAARTHTQTHTQQRTFARWATCTKARTKSELFEFQETRLPRFCRWVLGPLIVVGHNVFINGKWNLRERAATKYETHGWLAQYGQPWVPRRRTNPFG